MSTSFSLELDDRTDEERAKAKATKKAKKGYSEGARGPMDTDFLEDKEETPQIRINSDFSRNIQGIKADASQKDERFDYNRLCMAVSSGDVSKLTGLYEYLRKMNRKLTSPTYILNGKTVLLKALLNLRNGENETVEHLLDIAEKMDHLQELVNTAYIDHDYKGQTALHVAIERRSKRYAELLIQKGADVHAQACGTFFQPKGKACFYFGELPLSLAACTNQREIVDLLMDKADVRRTDSHGNTVLHALVLVANDDLKNTDFVISMYDYILTKDAHMNPKRQKLEDIANKRGLTPIKLAAKTGKIGLFQHMLQREFKQEECRHLSRKFTEWAYGPVYASLYDLASVDTYEKNSVLEIIVYGTEIPNRLEMLQIEPLNNLLEDKWNRFAHRIFFFNFICYLIYLAIFTTVCCYHTEHRERDPPYELEKTTKGYLQLAGQIFVLAVSVYFFLKGLMDLKRKPPRLRTLVTDGYSDLVFFFQAVCFLVCAALYLLGRNEYLAFLVVCLALSWINVLYFSRGSRHMGIYSVMIQRMILGDILRFLFVYIVFLVGFSAAVMTLLYEKSDEQSTVRTTTVEPPTQNNQTNCCRGRKLFAESQNESCVKPTYKNIYFTTLELFKFTIGMGDLEFTEQYLHTEVFYVLLISYIVLTYILLLNMLIAMMSKRVEKMSDESTNIWKLQRAITTLDLERSLCPLLKTKLRSGVKKNLGMKEEDKRQCLRVEEVNWNKWNRDVGIINDDPGDSSRPLSPSPRAQRGQSWRVFLRDFSRRRPNNTLDVPLDGQEMRPLAPSPV